MDVYLVTGKDQPLLPRALRPHGRQGHVYRHHRRPPSALPPSLPPSVPPLSPRGAGGRGRRGGRGGDMEGRAALESPAIQILQQPLDLGHEAWGEGGREEGGREGGREGEGPGQFYWFNGHGSTSRRKVSIASLSISNPAPPPSLPPSVPPSSSSSSWGHMAYSFRRYLVSGRSRSSRKKKGRERRREV